MPDKIKKPTNKGICRVPVVMQLERLECGAASLCMILAYYGRWVPLEQMREDCGVSRDGANAKNIVMAAERYGLKAEGFRYEPETLKKKGMFPCIVHWNFNHFIVVNGFRGNKVYINDPGRGNYCISMEEFDKGYTGICLLFEPGENFVKGGKQKSVLSFAAKRLEGMRPVVVFVVLMWLVAGFMEFTRFGMSRIFVDRLLSGADSAWTSPFFLLLAGFAVVEIIASALKASYSLRINAKIAAEGNAAFMWKVLKMPIRFFSQRMSGDIQKRQEDNAAVAKTLVNTIAPIVFNIFMMVFYLLIMIRYSAMLAAAGVIALIINSFVSRRISDKRINITREAMRDRVMLYSTGVSGIDMIETIKSSGTENGFFRKWAGQQAQVNLHRVRFLKLDSTLGIVPEAVCALVNNLIMVLGIWLIWKGYIMAGMLMAFQSFYSAFMAPASEIINAGQTIQEMRAQMERIDDIMEYPDDGTLKESNASEDLKKLRGNIEIKNISFGYSPLEKPLIKDFNLTVAPGQMIAIVGASGSGKSTLSRLVSGLYKPWEGEILFDGKPLDQIPKNVFRGSLAVVDQEIVLFEDTIANNIKMWDGSIKDFEMIIAAKDARIHEDIMKRPGGYQYKLAEGGKDFSGGQRQRIEIARALAQDPLILILDEGTSALDAQTEYEVVKAIRDREITCIVISHRLSAIRSADEIIVLEDGGIKDRGTHKELLATSKAYNDIVSAE